MAHPGGRPSKYTSEVKIISEDYLSECTKENMKLPTVEGLCLKIGIKRETAYEWAKIYPEFSDTLDEIKTRQKEMLTEVGIFGGKEINANIVALFLKANHGMIETQRNELVGEGGGPLAINIISDYISQPGSYASSVSGTEGQDEIQGGNMAQKSEKDINGAGKDSTGSA